MTLKALMGPSTLTIIAHELRPDSAACFAVLRDGGFRFEKYPNNELHEHWRAEDIGVLKISLANPQE